MSELVFELPELTEDERLLQKRVRAFLAKEWVQYSHEPGLGMNSGRDAAFSKKLGDHGWIGMSLPRRFGGAGRSAVDRFILAEELLRVGAPVAYHWVADRQSGPMIDRFGTSQQKERFLPKICAGQLSFALAMSEPDAGSDLASLTSRAVRTTDGWRLSGTKLWTSGALKADWLMVLCRSSDETDRHAGITQYLVETSSPGLGVNPIRCLDGSEDFCEVIFEDVFVPDDCVLGVVGEGWSQVTSELVFERAGPDRWLSTYLVLESAIHERAGAQVPREVRRALGALVAELWTIRLLSLSVARRLDAGESPDAEAALVKILGTRFEQRVLEVLRVTIRMDGDLNSTSLLERLFARSILSAPSYTVRGGTTEVLRTVVARRLRV